MADFMAFHPIIRLFWEFNLFTNYAALRTSNVKFVVNKIVDANLKQSENKFFKKIKNGVI